MLSFSTCWNSGRHEDGAAMLEEILDLGFEWVELGHGIRLTLMEGIQRVFEQGRVKFSSLHNFCPLPIEVRRASPDCYLFSSPDQRERDRAVRLTFQTIDFAVRLGAPNVVLHMGRVPIDDYTLKLVKMAELGMIDTHEYARVKNEGIQRRRAIAERHFMRARDSLARIVDYAGERGINLGVESRHSFEEIPSEREMIALMEEFRLPHVGYWHDFGHVQVKNNLGFLVHEEWMNVIAPRLLGCHLHDTQWPGRDHMAPFTGDVPYDALIPLLPKKGDTLFVFEMSPRRTVEEITTARDQWIERFGA